MSDFPPIALLSADPTVLMVPSEAKWKTLKDLIEDAKANPGKISYSSSGIYGTTHTAGEMLAQAAGVKFLHVPYGGGGPAMKATRGHGVMFPMQGPSGAAPHVKSGRFRLLGSWGGKRIPSLPDVPTMKEQGCDAEFCIWAAWFGPHGIPQGVEARLRQASRQVPQDAECKKVKENVNTP